MWSLSYGQEYLGVTGDVLQCRMDWGRIWESQIKGINKGIFSKFTEIRNKFL